ncbi:tetratricopeptide repeat protein [Aquibacillus saliphilus]|uniref:tetratricopeptide repeat protein n=1 Tax=Aquibacillus saliphilus TaxID=1909422 RepID=UPI001CEFD5F2|nr:tetratricopeptide repeat protein [Aquibacillus saliphilus]
MDEKNDNVIMFPKWKSTLEQESMIALKEKRYDDALVKLNELISYDVNKHEIMMGKLICLMELGDYDDAEDLCQQLIGKNDQYFFDYIHIYCTLLFQQSEYDQLIEQLDEVFLKGDIPSPLQSQLWQLYEISKKLKIDNNEEKATYYINQLKTAVNKKDPVQQWRILNKSRAVTVNSHLEYLKKLLITDEINPLVKTAVIEWLQEQKINQQVSVSKFECTQIFIPEQLSTINSHKTTIQILENLHDIEQDNPSLFELIKKLLYRYLYVRYPMMPSDNDLVYISKALKLLGYQYLQLDETVQVENEEKLNVVLLEIINSEKKYFEIIGE